MKPERHTPEVCTAFENYFSDAEVDGKHERQVDQWIGEGMHFCAGLRRDLRVVEESRKASQRLASPNEGMAVSQKIGARHNFECRAKTGEGVWRQTLFVGWRKGAELSRPSLGNV
ncbi:hypothetical protein BKA70DRAFT_1223286 [Coprinopsis sp. MPI-PUGE-AT-0042]|nr:hypothetical protein BKA70DRAFT_1223286 [Coprinopsis sp. MPI-PUGE-AT-0042]